MTPSHSSAKGIALKLGSVAFFVTMSASIKLAGTVPTGQIVFYRSLFAMVPILGFLLIRRELFRALGTRRPLGHALRALCGATSIGLFFFAITRLPLSETIILGYAQPVFAVILSAVIFREMVRPSRWLAVFAGLLGVVIVAWPNLVVVRSGQLDEAQFVGAIAAVGAAFATALSVTMLKSLVSTERSSTIVLWFSLMSTLFALATIPFGWAELTRDQAMLLAFGGMSGGLAHVLVTESLRHADVSLLAPFDYTSAVLAMLAGYLLFAEVPTAHMFVGGAIISIAGLILVWKERFKGSIQAS